MTVEAAARGVGLVPAFQPIVDLADNSVVGFEALARWPGLDGLGPQEVFAYARERDQVDVLDQRCIDVAIDHALAAELSAATVLSLNCEPSSAFDAPATHQALLRAKGRLRVMFEITERSMLEQPHLLLAKVAALRADGFLIALDDVGAHPDSAALLDVLLPDVIKLDLALVQSQPTAVQAQTLSAVLAHHERTGAVILAEGIESADHLEQALALGAALGQGYRFGRPGRLTGMYTNGSWPAGTGASFTEPVGDSPFALIEGQQRVRTARKKTVLAFSRHIETLARQAADPPIVLVALQSVEHLSARTLAQYRDLGSRSPLVAIFGQDVDSEPAVGIRGVALAATDPMCAEWTVVVLGPHTAAALIARERPQEPVVGADGDRRFDFVITYDRELVTATARSLLNRMR